MSKMRCDLIELDEPPVGQHPPHLRFEMAPLRGAVEILEHREAALQQVAAERRRLAIGQVPESRLPHERDRILEQLGIVERQDAAAVRVDVDVRQLSQDQREVLLGARVVVIPGGAEAAAARRAQVRPPSQPHEREPAVVGEVVSVGHRAGRTPWRR